jgi:small GTP-binding protein
MADYDYLFKFVLIGETFVGKSCLMTRFVEDKFEQETEPTIGVEFGTRTLPISERLVKIQIWDTAGQENYHSITRSYFKGWTH